MSTDLSKLCADHLRDSYTLKTSSKLKATHARELVAAFFGYKSHAALLAEKVYPLDNLEQAAIFVPDITLLEQRRSQLLGLPDTLFSSITLAEDISDFLQKEKYFSGNLWIYDSLETYIVEVLLINHDDIISDAISGTMAEINASFEHYPDYNDAKVEDTGEALKITVSGVMNGTPSNSRLFNGDTIDLGIQLTLPRIAGKSGFLDFEIEAVGTINDDWSDKGVNLDIPHVRPKEQWLQMTGGFQFGETEEQFQMRLSEINTIRNSVNEGNATARDIQRLSFLLGEDEGGF